MIEVKTFSLETYVVVCLVLIFAGSLIAGVFNCYVVVKYRFWDGLMQFLVAIDTFALLGLVITDTLGAIAVSASRHNNQNGLGKLAQVCTGINLAQFNFEILALASNASMLLLYVYMRRWVVYGNKLIRYDVVKIFFVVFWVVLAIVGSYIRSRVQSFQVEGCFCLGVLGSNNLIIISQTVLYLPFVMGCLCLLIGWCYDFEEYNCDVLRYYNDLYFWFGISFVLVHLPPAIVLILDFTTADFPLGAFGISNNWKCVQNIADGFIFYFLVFKKIELPNHTKRSSHKISYDDDKSTPLRFDSVSSELTEFNKFVEVEEGGVNDSRTLRTGGGDQLDSTSQTVYF